MLLPSIFAQDLFEDWPIVSRDFDTPFFQKERNPIMKTDVKEKEDLYEIAIDLPGYKKEDISAEVKDGYLIVSASTQSEEEEKEEGVYLRRERYAGSVSRSFYVGDHITEEDIKAKYENGILQMTVPKGLKKAIADERHYVAIAG